PGSEPQRVDITLGSAAAARTPRLVSAQDHLGDLSCDTTGRASGVEVRGTVHWLTHRDGPARALSVTPDARARMPRVLGSTGDVVWVSDAGGSDALEVAPGGGPGLAAVPAPPRRLAEGAPGLGSELGAAPDGATWAAAAGPDPPRPAGGRDHRGCHRRALQRLRAGVHDGRALPGLPVGAQLRSHLRRALF